MSRPSDPLTPGRVKSKLSANSFEPCGDRSDVTAHCRPPFPFAGGADRTTPATPGITAAAPTPVTRALDHLAGIFFNLFQSLCQLFVVLELWQDRAFLRDVAAAESSPVVVGIFGLRGRRTVPRSVASVFAVGVVAVDVDAGTLPTRPRNLRAALRFLEFLDSITRFLAFSSSSLTSCSSARG